MNEVGVYIDFGRGEREVGRLVEQEKRIYFGYTNEWLKNGHNLSPLSLPFSQRAQSGDPRLFSGLPGLVYDSLPDAWGRRLTDAALAQKGYATNSLTALGRLSLVGRGGPGAITYKPSDNRLRSIVEEVDVELLATQAAAIERSQTADLRQLVALSGMSGGMRPKVTVAYNREKKLFRAADLVSPLPEGFQYWMIKFPSMFDESYAGVIEYIYSLMAGKAGIDMAPCELLSSKHSAGYFATQRFDRRCTSTSITRKHVHTMSGIMHVPHSYSDIDYLDVIRVAMHVSKSIEASEQIFRLAVFNFFSGNCDDHTKNCAVMMNENGHWTNAPAYDITPTPGIGVHCISYNGKLKPDEKDLVILGKQSGLAEQRINEIIEQSKYAVGQWGNLAKKFGVPKKQRDMVQSSIIV